MGSYAKGDKAGYFLLTGDMGLTFSNVPIGLNQMFALSGFVHTSHVAESRNRFTRKKGAVLYRQA
jgi:hypothetical protein